jgi:hypothetical protein
MWGRLLQRGPAFVHAKIPSGVADLGPPSALPHARRDRMGRGRRDRRSTGLTLKALLLSPGQLARRDDQPTVGRVEQAHFSVARFRLAYCFIRHPAYLLQYQWLAIYQQVTASYVSAKSRGGPACQRTDAIIRCVENPANTPPHRLAARAAAVAGVTPVVDVAGGAKGVADEGSSNLTLQTTAASVGRVRRTLQVGVASPTREGLGAFLRGCGDVRELVAVSAKRAVLVASDFCREIISSYAAFTYRKDHF